MLEEIRISGLGVIDEAELELGPGLTVVTGETGAGKTMVVTGLLLLFGGRADAGRVTGGRARAAVDGRLRLAAGSAAYSRAIEAGAEPDDDGTFIVSRTVTAEGRSRAHLGGRSVPIGVLGELAEGVLAVHGQSDQLRLLRPAEQRAALDRYAGAAVATPHELYSTAFRRWQELARDVEERTANVRERAQEADLLRHGLAEIAAAAPLEGEDAALDVEASRLANVEALRLAATTAHDALAGDLAGDQESADVGSLLGAARRALAAQADSDQQLGDLEGRLAEAGYLVSDVAAELASYVEDLDSDPARLQEVLDRRSVLSQLVRKYADSVDGVLAWAKEAEQRLEELDTSDETVARLTAERDAAATEAAGHASTLSAARREAAERFGSAVTAELAGLAMPNATATAEVRPRPVSSTGPVLRVDGTEVGAGPDGVDEVELLLVPHVGAPARPLHRGASGGELSRVMLAVEVVFADADPVPTMVFDEVDSGVGGRAAVEVGRRLARLAASHQVLVVTHLPQVAAYADRHVVVDKKASADGAAVTRSDIRLLDDAGRVGELARMLAGLDDSELGKAHAEELITRATSDKRDDRDKKSGKSGAKKANK